MKREIQAIFTAVMFYTRIPCPSWVDHSEEYLQLSRKYFPLIGWAVGGISGLVFLVLFQVFPSELAIIFSMVTGVIMTGAFHEDGFADTMDGFGGGWTKEKILLIMKDSKLGTYGAIGLFLMLAIKFLALYALVDWVKGNAISNDFYLKLWGIFIAGHTISRFVAFTFFRTHQYAKANDEVGSKSKPLATSGISISDYFIGAVFGLIPLTFLENYAVFLVLIPCFIAKWWMGSWFKKWIGGYTGDCLGAVQQVVEIIFYLSLMLVWKYI
ncbi:adenosylcobinamide-GDP ribazoletransferase [Echinicola jeungdonensis]|uniref:Adenosylcobinamide-GDP ribazoletransferase n=1 Tax=Echinicola jeungdonensis TaxID=709343 RepID=A0ABV5J5L9_9BACT|nr:adenosylcobinamide-GDP ribazoletransferase [Echinicola jeungdonensis]MDN3671032.1 adenosylcobinamide-GDP ribazoletransferase [Echinicola jeungdonensis]